MLTSGKNLLSVNEELVLSAPPLRPHVQKGRKFQPARVVRFEKAGRDLGRLESSIGQVLSPAMQSGFVIASCRVVSAPKVVRMFSEVFLDLSLFLTQEAFSADTKQVEAGLEEKNGGEGVDAGRLNVVHMLTVLRLCAPPQKPAVDFPVRGQDEEDAADPGTVTEESAEAYYKTVNAIDGSDANAFKPPRHIACTLREYQRAGVGWMVAREKHGSLAQLKDPESVDIMIDPLWKKKVFPDGGVFFLNPTTGVLSIDAPVGNSGGPYGGILADEMGLGKTVQCIACIVHDQEELLNAREHQTNGKILPSLSKPEVIVSDELESPDVMVASPTRDASNLKERDHSLSPEPDACMSNSNYVDSDAETVEEKTLDVKKHDESNALVENGKKMALKTPPPQRRCRKRRLHQQNHPRSPNFGSEEEEEEEEDTKDDGDDDDWSHEKDEASCDGVEESDQGSDDDYFENPVKEKKSLNPKKKQKVATRGSQGKRASVTSLLMKKARGRSSSNGGTLIVCPTSLVTQWMNELSLHVTPNFLRITTHYGTSRRDAYSISLQTSDVVVTSYGVLASEYSTDSDKGGKDRPNSANGPIFQLKWRRVILDEAHTIKSRTTRWARAAYHITAERRWCITGTVIHNHVNDVFSLLHFLQVTPWSSWAFWNRGIVANLESKELDLQKTAMSLIRDIISSVTLRRKKTTKDSDGKCIVSLTKKNVEIVSLTPSPEEQDFYSALLKRSQTQFDAFLAQGKVLNNYASILELILRLRQACDHPYLVFAAAPSKDSVVMKDKDKLYKQFLEAGSSSQYVEKVLNDASSGELGKSKECSLCLDIIDDPVAPRECGHPGCRSCLMEAVKRTKKCPVCRVAISPDSIITLPRSSRFSVDLKKKWRSSAKIDALLKEMKERQALRELNGGEAIGKTIIFSQFTSMLDLVGVALEREKFKMLRIDGSVPQAKRAVILQQFHTEDELSTSAANILLVSLRAGGVGLNLVAASHAILLDIHWNPQVDAQAQDRVHRHGQTRDVFIKRYIVKGSIEEKLLRIQGLKQDIADGALGVASEDDKKQARISELKLLFSAV